MTREEIETIVIDELEFLIKYEEEREAEDREETLLAALKLVIEQFKPFKFLITK